MSAAATPAAPPPQLRRGTNPWLIAVVVALATFMEVLDTTIANVALPLHRRRPGRQRGRSLLGGDHLSRRQRHHPDGQQLPRQNARPQDASSCSASALSPLSSMLCGFAWNLQSLLLFRILQGFGGGGMVPVAQSILADSFPPAKRGQAFALFGVAVVVAPVVGPTLGGWLSDNFSWHWCFLINGPVGLLAIALIALLLQRAGPRSRNAALRQQGGRFDLVGFVLVATFLGSLEVVLDRGLRTTGSARRFIITFAVICVAGLRADDPVGVEPTQPDRSTCAWWRRASSAPASW